MKRVLVLGASGMAGHVIAIKLKDQGYKVDTLSTGNSTIVLDVLDLEKFKKILSQKQYDIIINCIGILVKQSNSRRDLSVYLNSFLPHFLEHYYENSSTRIIHISSDGVFSGNHPPHNEGSACDSNTFYGKTKALGELNNEKDLTIRTSIIGPELANKGKSLVDWVLKQKGTITGYTNVQWKGVTTIELADAISDVLMQDISGIYHLVPHESVSKLRLVSMINDSFKLGLDIEPGNGQAINNELINTRKDIKHTTPTIEVMIQEMKSWVDYHSELYKHYEKTEK